MGGQEKWRSLDTYSVFCASGGGSAVSPLWLLLSAYVQFCCVNPAPGSGHTPPRTVSIRYFPLLCLVSQGK